MQTTLPEFLGSTEHIETRLENGLKALIIEFHSVPLCCCVVYYGAGKRHEKPGCIGISHFLEHLLIKNSSISIPPFLSSLPGSRRWGSRMGFTSIDYTCYSETLPRENVELALRIQADRMENFPITSEIVESERSILLAERRSKENRFIVPLRSEVLAKAYCLHPYRWFGKMDEVEKISFDALSEYHQQFYCSENAFLVVVGDIEVSKVLPAIHEIFGKIPRKNFHERTAPAEPEQDEERRVVVSTEHPEKGIMIVYHAPLFWSDDYAAMEVLSGILNGYRFKRTSRFQRTLVQAGIAQEAGCALGLTKDPWLFSVFVTASGDCTMEALEKAILEEIEKIQTELVEVTELENAKRKFRAAWASGLDGPTRIANKFGRMGIIAKVEWHSEFLSKVAQVSKEDIRKVAQRYLHKQNRTVGVAV